jgi:D-sedoheptulose 7-phosphate isomerase
MSLTAEIAATQHALAGLAALEPAITRAGDLILHTLQHGGRLLLAGNGGSAAEAAHFATELTGRYQKNRRALPALALPADGSLLTCVGNDYAFDAIFARQVEAHGRPGDLLVVLSSSGHSRNLLAALDAARAAGLATLALLGRGGGAAAGRADVEIIVPGDSGRTAQEAHLFLIHHFCERLDAAFA